MGAADRIPRKTPRQERSRVTVERILAAAAQVFGEEGAEATTDRIAVRAAVSVGSVYQYFPNKQAIILELTRRHLGQASAALDRVVRPGLSVAEQLPGAVAAVAALHEDGDLHRLLYVRALSDPEVADALDALNRAWVGRVADLLSAEGFSDPATTAQVLVALVESLTHRLVDVMDAASLQREVTRAAVAYLQAA